MLTSNLSESVRSTPARAIPSSLAAKTSPSIPPPTQTYEPLVKTVLRHRLIYNIFLQSALITWATVIAQTIWQRSLRSLGISGFFLLPIHPSTVVCSGLIWLFVALPVIVIRRFLLSSTRTPATSPANSLSNALSKPSITRVYIATSISALVMLFLHALMAYNHESIDPKLRIFVKSKKHPHYLNGRLLFLIISQIALGVSYVTRNIMLDRYVYQWNLSGQKQHPGTNFNAFYAIKTIIVSIFLSFLALPLAALGFASARLVLPILYKIPFFSSFLRPFTAHFLRGSWTIFLPFRNLDLIQRSCYLGTVTCLIWEAADTLFELNITKHISVSHLTIDPNETTTAGISSTDLSFKYFAYCELQALAQDQSTGAITQRTALFMDQKHSPTLWARLVRESLITLGKDYQFLLRRGKPELPPLTISSTSLKSTNSSEMQVSSKEVPLLRRRIFKTNREDTLDMALDTVASNGPLTKVVDASVKAIDLPEIFRSAETKLLPSQVSTSTAMVKGEVKHVKGVVDGVKNKICERVRGLVERYLPVPVLVKDFGERGRDWWTKDRLNKVVEVALPCRELDVVIVEVISRFTCASLTEDRYGVVQKDIPRILEAFLSYLEAIEKYQVEVNSLYVAPNEDDDDDDLGKVEMKELRERGRLKFEAEKAGEVLGEVADGLKEGIARIVRTFGDKLLAFKFPPRTAKKLQGFLDYC